MILGQLRYFGIMNTMSYITSAQSFQNFENFDFKKSFFLFFKKISKNIFVPHRSEVNNANWDAKQTSIRCLRDEPMTS